MVGHIANADAGKPRGGGDTILLKFSKNCMKSRKIWSLGGGGGRGAPPGSTTALEFSLTGTEIQRIQEI